MKLSLPKIVGSALVLLGLLSLEPVLGAYALPDRFTEFPGNAVAAIASLVLIGTGLSMIFWRARIAFLRISGKETWVRAFLVTFPVLLLVSAEGILISLDELKDPVDADDIAARKMMKANWGKKHYKGVPVVAPAKSSVFNINADGFRTYDLDTPRKDEIRILLLGGSTGFGWRVADRHVIDRYLEQFLEQRTRRTVKVFNLSIPAVAFATENMVFEDFSGRVSPDAVVFYHGANDATAWFEQTIGRSDSRQNLAPSLFSRKGLLYYAYKSRIFRLAVETLAPPQPPKPGIEIDVTKPVKEYEFNFRKSQQLCASKKCLYVIQPILFDKRPRTSREVKLYRRAAALFPQYEQMYPKFTDALIARGFPNHVDARNVFTGSTADIFLDYVHVSPEGNRMLARFVADALCNGGYLQCRAASG